MKHYKESIGRKVFLLTNNISLILITVICLLPFLHIIAVSFSSKLAATAGEVGIIPVDFTFEAYGFVMKKSAFIVALGVSLKRVILGTSIYMLLTILTAYPLSKEVSKFRARTIYAWIFVFTMLFSGGLIPTYIIMVYTGLIDTIWALVIPTSAIVWNIILLLNFFRNIPKELEEAAFLDGAGHMAVLFKVFIPVSLPALATILLFIIVYHWNSWFDGLIYMNFPRNYPLQTYLQTVIVGFNPTNVSPDDLKRLQNISAKAVKAAQIFLGTLPILAVYPFLQRYFVTGIVLGSVKG